MSFNGGKMMRPLEGMRIIAVDQYGAGPYATLHLADLGAEVIKIEDPGTKGDVSRYVIPYSENDDSLFFQSLNRNKKSISLNLKSAEGRRMFEELVKKSDAVFNNLRGDVPEKLKIKYEHLKHLNPKIVTCSLSGFGTTGSIY
jgi:crotonobetainyl-CoA:carnitine CoA-transferase CaiB-like acyl-CoA transferase